MTRRELIAGASTAAFCVTNAPALAAQTAFDWNAVDANVITTTRDIMLANFPLIWTRNLLAGEAGGALKVMFAQWETCGLMQWAEENLAALWEMPVDPDKVSEAAAQMGITLPDGWWTTTAERMQRWKHGGAMWQENARRLLEYHPEAANPWWAVGGFGLVLIGAAAIAFAPATIAGLAIVGAGIGIAGIGVGFIVAAGY